MKQLGDVVTYIRGISFAPEEKVAPHSPDSAVCMRTANIQEELEVEDLIAVPRSCVKRREQYLRQGDILLSSANSWNLVGKCVRVPHLSYAATAGGFISIVRVNFNLVDPDYIYRWLAFEGTQRRIRQCARQTTNIANLDVDRFLKLTIPLPPLAEQKRIAAVLAKADRVRRLRRYALEVGAGFLQSVFVEMFGDPATNPMGWERKPLRSLSSRFSDGPFGSNLKSEHYVTSGVRVIRLQNVGVGVFLDEDEAFISTTHFQQLQRHQCLPGDLIIATLGDPNLRACILPSDVSMALNKADCIQMRVDTRKAVAQYVCWLLNHPATLQMTSNMIHGQTRSRINSGQLAQLDVMLPPLDMQLQFSQLVHRYEHLRCKHTEALRQANHLMATLLHQCFNML